MKKLFNKLIITAMVFAILITGVFADTFEIQKLKEEKVTHGTVRTVYKFPVGDEQVLVNVLTVDLDNPNVKVNVVPGKGKTTQRASVTEMAEATGAVTMVNGDFFNTRLEGTPEGVSVIDGKILVSPCVIQDTYTLGFNENGASIEQIKFQGSITANGNTFAIDGLNKSYYWYEPDTSYSHQDRIQMYNDFWAAKTRGDRKNSEVLISGDGIVEEISEGKNFDFPVPDGKIILQVDGKAYDFVKANMPVGTKVDINYSITPDRNWTTLLGGHSLLVDNYQKVKYTKDLSALGGVRARTAAGISQSGKTLYIISVEGRTERSRGISLNALSDFLVQIGVYKAINLDGGGSTAMVVRELGDKTLTRAVNPERNAQERRVVNGLGLYNIMPATGQLSGVTLKGPDEMIVGESAEFGLRGAYDTALQPMDTQNISANVYDRNGTEYWNGSYMMAQTPGEVEIVLETPEGINTSKVVKVNDLTNAKVILEGAKKVLSPGESIDIKAVVKKSLGEKVEISPSIFTITSEGFTGSVTEYGNVYVESFNGSNGKIIFTYKDKAYEYNIFNSANTVVELGINTKEYKINDANKKMDQAPFIEDSRTLVPIRFIAEAMGGKVEWDEANRIVVLNFENKEIKIPVGQNKIFINGTEKAIDTSAKIKSGRTFVPIRFIAENLDMEVVYNDSMRKVFIISKDELKPYVEPVKAEENSDTSK